MEVREREIERERETDRQRERERERRERERERERERGRQTDRQSRTTEASCCHGGGGERGEREKFLNTQRNR